MSYEKSVKGATKIKAAPPKSKYVEHILQATRTGDAGVAEVFRVLQLRLRDPTWTISFKALIVIHLMIREGAPNVALSYLSSNPRHVMNISQFTDAQIQGRNIRDYAYYLIQRARSFQKARVDYVLDGAGRLKKLSVDKGLLRETESVQDQIQALLKCDIFFSDELGNEITLTAFRLLTMDLLVLYQVMNEGTINVLENYFEMSRPDAERALEIYKTFTKLTQDVVKFLHVARQQQQFTRLEIPKLKHAPTGLASSLEEYLNDKDFEINRRQYIAQQMAKKGKKPLENGQPSAAAANVSTPSKPTAAAADTSTTASQLPQPTKGPAPDLIDFFDSIEQNQQPMAQNPSQFQQTAAYQQPPLFSSGFQNMTQPTGGPTQPMFASAPFGQPQQSTNPFEAFQPQTQPQSSQFTGAGFGGYMAPLQQQPQQQLQMPDAFSQNGAGFGALPSQGAGLPSSFGGSPQSPQQTGGLQRQPTNPFRQSSLPNAMSSAFNSIPRPSSQQGKNPFARASTIAEEGPASQTFSASPFRPQTAPGQPLTESPKIQPQHTGTNPFARTVSPSTLPPLPQQAPAVSGGVATNMTGSTNPFRQSAFVNSQTGQGWQMSPQNTMGGLENMDTIPVFPRPGQPAPQQQQSSSPWQ